LTVKFNTNQYHCCDKSKKWYHEKNCNCVQVKHTLGNSYED
jgi:hypothetical protein